MKTQPCAIAERNPMRRQKFESPAIRQPIGTAASKTTFT